MAVKVASVEFDLITNVAKYADDMGRAARATEDAAGKMAKSMKKAEKGFADFGNGVKNALAVGALTASLVELGKNIDDQEKGLAQVRASLQSTGGAAGVTEKSILDLADSIKKLTAVDDDAVVAMDSVLLTFTKVGKEVFPEATRAIVDMSAKLGTDLKASAIQVGKALQDPIKGVTALQRVGVSFSESQKDVIKNLVETGHAMDAQKLILRELNTEFGGSAAAMRDTFGGALTALQVRVGDLFQAVGGSGGLRTGIETLIVMAEKGADVLTQMNNPATELGKQAEKFNAALNDGINTGMAWTNALIYGFVNVGEKIKAANDWAVRFMDNYYKIVPGAGVIRDLVTGMVKGAGDGIAAADKTFKDGAKSGVVPNYFQGIIDDINAAKKKMAELHAAASQSKPFVARDPEDGGSGNTAKAQLKKLEAEKRAVAEIVAKYKLKALQAGEVSKEQRQYNELLEEERQIQKRTLIPVQERKAAIDQLHAAYNQMIAAEKAAEEAKKAADRVKAIAAEREGLQDLLDSMRQEIEETKAKKTLNESMIPIWEAERQIKEHTKKFSAENLDLQKQILQAAKEQSELIVQQKHDDALKTLKEITEEYKKEQEAAEAKVKGQENYNKLLADEKKIRDDIHLSDKEKDAGVADIKAADAATKTANKAYEAQKKIIKDILAAKGSDALKTQKLNDALKAGTINAKEYEDAVADLNNTTSKTGTLGGQLSSIFGNAFSSLISGGSKATDIVKNVGKEIANLAAKKLLLEPLGKMFDSWANSIFGVPSGGAVGAGNPAQKTSWLGALGKSIPMLPGAFKSVSNGMQSGLMNTGGSLLGGITGAFGGGASFLANLLKFETGGYFASRDAIQVGENGLEMVWPGGYGSPNPFLAGLNGPEIISGRGGGYVSNAQETASLLSGQDIALSEIGVMRQRAADASRAGRPLSYFELQDMNAQMFDKYKRGLDWSTSDELDLARIMDSIVKAKAEAAMAQERMTGSGGDFNWRSVANNLQSQDGLGFERSVAAGGRANFADGNQQREILREAEALNIPVPSSLWSKAGLMADVWDQQDQISGGTAQSRLFYNLIGSYGGSGYKSMGMSGNNINNSVFGGDPLDMNSGANGMERYEAFGGKDWQWQKFHNANLSYGGGNYVGDANYGKSNRGFDFQGPTKGGGRGGITTGTPDSGANLTRLVEHWTQNGIKGRSLDQLIEMFGGTLPPRASVPSSYDTKNEQMDAVRYYQKLTGGTSHPELGTLDGFKGYAQGKLSQFAEMAGIGGSGLTRIESWGLGVPSGGAVGAPGRLSTSNDVFDQGNYGSTSQKAPRLTEIQRMNSPNRNFADGFMDGRIGASLGAYTGATAPIGGWATKYSGGRASGGRVNAGRLYSVAERGDELFMPEKAGNVIPIDKLRGGNSQPPVIINNQAIPDNQVQVSMQGGQAVVNLLKASINEDPRMNAALAARFGLKPRTALSG